jgi:hypothetical protein
MNGISLPSEGLFNHVLPLSGLERLEQKLDAVATLKSARVYKKCMREDRELAVGTGNEETENERRTRRLGYLKAFLVVAILALTVVVVRRGAANPNGERRACINNLLQINAAKAMWAEENRRGVGAVPRDSDIFGKYMKYPPRCPSGGKYVVGGIGTGSTCSLAGKGHAVK